MTTRLAACSCGALSLTCAGEPVRISICHCLACQRRTGSAYGYQARLHRDQIIARSGDATEYVRIADSGNPVRAHFCATCGTTLYWELSGLPEFVGVAVGAFADPKFPPPTISIYEDRAHAFAIPTHAGVEHIE